MGCLSQSTIACIQRFQSKVLRTSVNAPWYVRSSDLHRDEGVKSVVNEIMKIAKSHELWLRQHVNEKAARLVETAGRKNPVETQVFFRPSKATVAANLFH